MRDTFRLQSLLISIKVANDPTPPSIKSYTSVPLTIGTLQRSLTGDSRKQTAFEQGEAKEGTIILEDYNLHPQISLLDTRGFFERDEKLMEECLNIMSGR